MEERINTRRLELQRGIQGAFRCMALPKIPCGASSAHAGLAVLLGGRREGGEDSKTPLLLPLGSGRGGKETGMGMGIQG